MIKIKKYLLLFSLSLFVLDLAAETKEDQQQDFMGTVWQLVKNGSHSSSFGGGQVVYFLSSDAYHTHRSRKFQTWDIFSIVDGRNILRLKKRISFQRKDQLESFFLKKP